VTGTRVHHGAVIAGLLSSVIACSISGPAGPLEREQHSVERGEATRARVEIGMSAGDLFVKSGATELFVGEFEFNLPALKPTIAYSVNGGTGILKVSQGSASGSYENKWHLSLDEMTPLELHLTLGAGDVQLELGRLNLESLAVQMGAGDLQLDLRGMPTRSYPVSVNAGAGDTTIHLPASVGISARTTGLIGDARVSGLEKRDDRWINPRAEASPIKIDLRVQHAIGDLKLDAE
jgi:hypothetical protein